MKPLLALVLLALLVIGGLFLMKSSGGDLGRETGVAVAPNHGAASSGGTALGEGNADPAEISGEDAQHTGSPGRVAFNGSGSWSSFEGDSKRFLPVSIDAPAKHPLDEPMELWAFFDTVPSATITEMVIHGQSIERVAQAMGGVQWSRTLFADGTGQLPLTKSDAGVTLVCVGRLIQPEMVHVMTSAKSVAEEQAFTPKLGACVEVFLNLPLDAERSSTECSLNLVKLGERHISGRMGASSYEAQRRVSDDQTQTLRGLEARTKWGLHVHGGIYADPPLEELALVAGKVKQLSISLERGAALRVRVIDSKGSPIPHVSINAFSDASFLEEDSLPQRRYFSHSDEQGIANLEGFPAGNWTVHVDLTDYVTQREDITLERGEERELVVVLEYGAVVTGHVRWPDGSPAEGVEVTIPYMVTEVLSGGERTYSRNQRVETDSAGEFSHAGLSEDVELGVVSAAVVVQEEGLARKLGVELGRHFAGHVRPLQHHDSLEIQLEPAFALDGLVRQGNGIPLAQSFSVSAWQANAPSWGRVHISGSFGNGDAGAPSTGAGLGMALNVPSSQAVSDLGPGVFHLDGFSPGDWMVQVESKGYRPLEPERVTLPATEDIEFVLQENSVLTGIILDPTGQPLPGALAVRREKNGIATISSDASEPADGQGRFSLSMGVPEALVRAEHPDYAPSETVNLSFAVGEPLEVITLRLRVGATVRGVVYREDGSPWPGQSVTAGEGPAMMQRMGPMGGLEPTRTDSAGRFELTGLIPGKLTVSAGPSREEFQALMSSAANQENPEQAIFKLLEKMLSTRVEVADGETVEVVLGALPREPVSVRGHITRAGKDVACEVMVLADEGPPLQGAKAAQAGEDGVFNVELDRPGTYVFLIRAADGSSGQESFGCVIPAVEVHQLDLALNSGSVAGVVLDPDGNPLEEVSLVLRPEDDASTVMDLIISRDNVRTNPDGSFLFSGVGSGRYILQANSGSGPRAEFVKDEYGYASIDGLILDEGQELADLVVQLPDGIVLRGIVRDVDGNPVSDADVFLRDQGGRLISTLSSAASRRDGSFEIRGLAPGSVSVFARKGELISIEAPSVVMNARDQGPAECELVMGSGTTLVLIPELEQLPVRIRASVVDDEGRNWSGLWTQADMAEWSSEGSPIEEVRIGPLPPGRYRVEATTLDGGASASKTVTVKEGAGERSLRLRLR